MMQACGKYVKGECKTQDCSHMHNHSANCACKDEGQSLVDDVYCPACKEFKPIPKETTMPETPERLERMDRPPHNEDTVEIVFEGGVHKLASYEGFGITAGWYKPHDVAQININHALGWRELQPYTLPLELPKGWHEYAEGTKPEDMGIDGRTKVLMRNKGSASFGSS